MCGARLGRDWLKLYYYWADTDQANSAPRPSWDSRVYRLLDVLAPRHTFTADSHSAHVHINHVTRSLPVNAAGQIRHSTVSSVYYVHEVAVAPLHCFICILCTQG